MKKLILLKIKVLSKLILKKYKPVVIGVTGSVGKTSAKQAIFAVLQDKFHVRSSIKNYNNEIGVPLTIIDAKAPGKSIFGWLAIMFKALNKIIFRDKTYPDFLILEMAVDKPGDMRYLQKIVKPKIGVMTKIGHAHIGAFNSLEKIQKEKMILATKLPKKGFAILNYDDQLIMQNVDSVQAKILTYGFSEGADLRAVNIKDKVNQLQDRTEIIGINFDLIYQGKKENIFLSGVIGHAFVYSALCGIAVGVANGMDLPEIKESLSDVHFSPGRMRIIPGIKRTTVIDDSYNASPEAVITALHSIKHLDLGSGKKFAVLGDMLELGKHTERLHQKVGREVHLSGFDKLIVVGERALDIAKGALWAGMEKDDIFHFANNKSAGLFIQKRIKQGDLILVKGSQGARMEKIVKEIMADPLRARSLLVRQSESWQ